ncbi:hypothetical protein D3C77_466390 [compost metagenome]
MRLDSGTVDQVQLAALTQQVVQVQVFLPQSFGVHPSHSSQGFAEHQLLLVRERRQGFNRCPGIGQALRTFEELEQQPTAFALAQTIGQ